MSALTQARMAKELRIKTAAFPLAAGAKAWQGGLCVADTTASVVRPGASGNTNFLRIGEFAENVDNSASTATTFVLVSLDKEVVARYYDSDTGGGTITSSNLFADVYVLDDHTVTLTAGSNSKAGRVWDVDAVKGIAVESYTL